MPATIAQSLVRFDKASARRADALARLAALHGYFGYWFSRMRA